MIGIDPQPSIINAGSQSIEFYEDVGDIGPVRGTFENGNSGVTQTIRVDWDDQEQAIRDILGTNETTAGNLTLNRDPPLQHPLYTAYYATRAEILNYYISNGKYVAGGIGNDIAQYDWAIIQITFNTLPFQTTFTAGQSSEFFRYTSLIPGAGVEFTKIGTTGINYQYNSSVTPPKNAVVPFGQGVRVPKGPISFKWWWVPFSYVFTESGYPSNIYAGLGCVNNAAWPDENGFPEGTLLALAPSFEPINSYEPDLSNGGPNRLFNITFNFLYFDPPLNPADIEAGFTGGHNTIPFSDGYYYNAVTQTTNFPLYESYNFNLFWQGI